MEKSDLALLIEPRLPEIAKNDPDSEKFRKLVFNPTPEFLHWAGAHRHKHFYTELLFVISGECPIFVGKNFFHCPAGTLFLLKPGEFHNSTYPAGARGVHIWMKLQKEMLLCCFYQLTASLPEAEFCMPWSVEYTDRDLLMRLNTLLDRVDRKEEGAETALAALFRMLFCELYRLYDPEADNRNSTMLNIGRFVRSTCGRGVDINYLARMAGCSRQHFMRRYREVNGCTVGETIRDSRLALMEIMPGNTPLKEAAERLGFDSAQSYCHWRRKIRSGGGRTAPPERDGAAKDAAASAGAHKPEG